MASWLQVLEIMELAPLAGALVGAPGQSGLSVEQRKRLTIGVELCANPSVIFMDEPTSGWSVDLLTLSVPCVCVCGRCPCYVCVWMLSVLCACRLCLHHVCVESVCTMCV